MKILLPLDGSPLSESTLPFARALARRWQAEVALVRASDPGLSVAPDLPQKVRAVMQQRSLAAAGEYLAHMETTFTDVPVTSHQPLGRPRDEIARLADQLHCDLIIMAFHGRTGPDRWLLGSVAEGVLRRSHCPVLLLHPPASEVSEFSNILIPVDGSPDSLRVFRRIAAYLSEAGKVTLLQCTGLDGQQLGPEEDSAYLEQVANQMREFKVDGLQPEVVVLHGQPAQTILDWATTHGCDLIAMSTHGRTGAAGLWLGSVTEKVARTAPCPVLAIPGGHANTQPGSLDDRLHPD